MSPQAVRSDLERLKGASAGGVSDASPFRTAVRNIIAACRNSPIALASYCREGVLPHLAAALLQVAYLSLPLPSYSLPPGCGPSPLSLPAFPAPLHPLQQCTALFLGLT